MRIAFAGDSLTAGVPGSSYFAILRQRLPDHTLINLGRGNDTVISLYRRLARRHFHGPLDIAFLWIGVNDMFGPIPWTQRIANVVRRQPRAEDLGEFQSYYQSTLELLGRVAGRVVAVAPLLRGENLDNPWNRQLTVLSSTIEDLASRHPGSEFLDLRPLFAQELAGKRTSGYWAKGLLRVALDALTLWTDKQIDRKAAQRGLYLTLDGLHLNSVGAGIVADAFARVIRGGTAAR